MRASVFESEANEKMREILFRAKRKDNGAWTEGYVFELQPGQYMICDRIQYDRPSTLPVWEFFRYCSHEVIPETICRCTGLKDNSGNLIWENDIVSCEHEKFQEGDAVEQYPFPDIIKYKRNYAVEFINTGSNYGYRLRNKSIHFMLTGNVIYNHKIEVIGNVFDNSELLKGDQSCTDL